MKLTCTSILALVLVTAGAFAEDQPLTVAVFDFNSTYQVKLHLVTDLVTAYLSAEPQLALVDRAALKKSLGEQAFGLSGNISPETAARVGQQTGAKVLVTGRLFRVSKDWTIITKIIGTESGRVYTDTVHGPESDLTKMAAEVSKRIAKTITEQSTNLLVKADPREERIERIIKSAKGDKRPVVLIRITEQYPENATMHHTAETELGFILQKAGFTVVDEKSNSKPDVEITGEAVCDIGTAKGDLLSCRANIEIKVQERMTGKILAFDRQKSTAVDIGKQTAANAALQNAADELAERLVPLLSSNWEKAPPVR